MQTRIKLLSIIIVLIIVLLVGASAFSILPHQANSATSGLVGYWKFDEGSGNIAYDSSGNGNDGTIYDTSWTAGKLSTGLSFDGTDDYVEVQDSPGLNPSSMTIMSWVNFRGFPSPERYGAANTNSMIVAKGTDDTINGFFGLVQRPRNAQPDAPEVFLFVFRENGYSYWVEGTTHIIEGSWYHVAGTYDGSTLKIYVNGVLEAENAINIARTSNSGNIQIGALRMPSYEYWTDGIIDEVKIYNRALTSDEIYNGYTGIEQSPSTDQTPFWIQWYFWTNTALGITTGVFAFTTLHYRKKALVPKKPKITSSKPATKDYNVCPNCGAHLPLDSEFCGKCGVRLE